MNTAQDLEAIFGIFHDGVIDGATIQADLVELKIEILYLAELIDEKYEFLHLTLKGVESIQFDAWTDETTIISDWRAVFDLEIEINSSEVDQAGNIVVYSYCDNAPEGKFSGGKLIISCSDYQLHDQGGNPMTLDELKKLSDHYWNDVFGKE